MNHKFSYIRTASLKPSSKGQVVDMKNAVILDMDGVVIDSNPFHRIAWKNFLAKHQITVDEEMFRTVIFGTTGDQALKKILNGNLTEFQVDAYVKEIDSTYREALRSSDHFVPLPGLRDFLKAAANRGCRIVLATSAPIENIRLVVDGLQLDGYFEFIIDKTQVEHGKPDPEIYLKAVDMINLEKASCVVFEDSLAGIQAAKRAGLRVVGVTTSHSAMELQHEGAFKTIRNFSEVDLAELFEPGLAG
jgi:HAD superfamily hydrolase (TIGR01509 family)